MYLILDLELNLQIQFRVKVLVEVKDKVKDKVTVTFRGINFLKIFLKSITSSWLCSNFRRFDANFMYTKTCFVNE